MIQFFLASVIWSTATTTPPDIVAFFPDEKACITDMQKLNAKVTDPAAKEAGFEFICLKVTRGSST